MESANPQSPRFYRPHERDTTYDDEKTRHVRALSYGSTSYELEKPPLSPDGGEEPELAMSPTLDHSEARARPNMGIMDRMRSLFSSFSLAAHIGGPVPPPGRPGPTPGMWTNVPNSPPQVHKSIEERLVPTLNNAKADLVRHTRTARLTSIALNCAIGVLVLLGALITGISAATTPDSTQTVTSVMGGLSTLLATYLARTRGSGEPEESKGRAKHLQKFVNNCQITISDWGHERPNPHDLTPQHVELLKRIDDHRSQYDNFVFAWNGGQVSPV